MTTAAAGKPRLCEPCSALDGVHTSARTAINGMFVCADCANLEFRSQQRKAGFGPVTRLRALRAAQDSRGRLMLEMGDLFTYPRKVNKPEVV